MRTELTDDTGHMYLDATPKRPLIDKVKQASDEYRLKYGHSANVCYVNPSMLQGDAELVMWGTMRVLPDRLVMVDHLLLGVAKSSQPPVGTHRLTRLHIPP